MNVLEVYRRQITGRGVVITIVDDGIETTHPDIATNYVRSVSQLYPL